MSLDILESTTRDIVNQLAREDYESAVRSCATSRLTSSDLRAAIHEYGRKLVSPPAGAYEHLDAVPVESTQVPTWSVRAPLWTLEEGRSDLVLELTIAVDARKSIVELDDLHVL